MRILVDTNILIDAFMDRDNSEVANSLLEQAATGRFLLFVAPHSLSNMYYIYRNDLPDMVRRKIIGDICRVATVVPVDNTVVKRAVAHKCIIDFEDALQYACAEEIDANYIVTRDHKGYPDTDILAITPQALLSLPELL